MAVATRAGARRRARARPAPSALAAVVVVAAAVAPLTAAAAAANAAANANADVLASLLALADGLYNHQNLSAVDAYCDPDVVVHGDGLWLPHVDFAGARWLRSIHREWFAAYSDWSCEVVAAALGTPTSVAAGRLGGSDKDDDDDDEDQGRARPRRRRRRPSATTAAHHHHANNAPQYVTAFALFRWRATNTAPYRGVGPTQRASEAWGVIEAVLWAPASKQAAAGRAVAALTLRDSGFLEVREASLQRPEPALPLSGELAAELRAAPEWVPSASLRQGAAARLASVLASLAVGGGGSDGGASRMAAVARAMADASTDDVLLADGTDVWGPRAPPERGKGAVAAWLALWAEQRGIERAEVAASAAASTSNKVFVSFRLAVPPEDDDDNDDANGGGVDGGVGGGPVLETPRSRRRRRRCQRRRFWPWSRPAYVEGVAVGVYDQDGRIARIVLFRNGSPSETRAEMIGGGGVVARVR